MCKSLGTFTEFSISNEPRRAIMYLVKIISHSDGSYFASWPFFSLATLATFSLVASPLNASNFFALVHTLVQ